MSSILKLSIFGLDANHHLGTNIKFIKLFNDESKFDKCSMKKGAIRASTNYAMQWILIV